MNDILQYLARHESWLLIGAVLGRQACLPIPANLVLIAAGALARSGSLSLPRIFFLSVLTFVLADLAWYDAGRRFGERILHFVCGHSGNPESCASRAITTFSKRGVRALLISKFVIGLDAVAAPLAGKYGVPVLTFMAFDSLGAALWTITYSALGYIFNNQLDRVAVHVMRLGTLMTFAILAGIGFILIRRFVRWYRLVRQFNLARITPEELREKLNANEDILLIDLQGDADSATERMAIPGAVRMDPRALEQYRDVNISTSEEVVLYCASSGELRSARVALALHQKGIKNVRPLAGGLRAWRDRGFPVTSDVLIPSSPAVAAALASSSRKMPATGE
jgi:membrane protein DedA with SNARE-associated domain/rhodanese-related sulfurtransferase